MAVRVVCHINVHDIRILQCLKLLLWRPVRLRVKVNCCDDGQSPQQPRAKIHIVVSWDEHLQDKKSNNANTNYCLFEGCISSELHCIFSTEGGIPVKSHNQINCTPIYRNGMDPLGIKHTYHIYL